MADTEADRHADYALCYEAWEPAGGEPDRGSHRCSLRAGHETLHRCGVCREEHADYERPWWWADQPTKDWILSGACRCRGCRQARSALLAKAQFERNRREAERPMPDGSPC